MTKIKDNNLKETRFFNEQWTQDYFFIQNNQKALCLICYEELAALKEYNLRRHCATKHLQDLASLKSEERKSKKSSLTYNFRSRQKSIELFT